MHEEPSTESGNTGKEPDAFSGSVAYRKEISELAAASRRLGELGYVTSSGGNLSLKTRDGTVLFTPTGIQKKKVNSWMIAGVSPGGEKIFGPPEMRPTSEMPMHLGIYRRRPDAAALIHAHPPALTGFALSDSELLSRPLHPEVIIELGPVLAVPYTEPTSEALAAAFDVVIDRANAFLMRNHGVLICSSLSIGRALELLEMLETFAASCRTALAVGNIGEIPPDEIDRLEAIMRRRKLPMPGNPLTVKRLRDLY